MTKKKDFKRVVRARMAARGESDAEARQHLEAGRHRLAGSDRPAFESVAMQTAWELGHRFSGEGHLLHAVLEDPSLGVAGPALAAAGITPDTVLHVLRDRVERSRPPRPRSGTLSTRSTLVVVGRADGFALGAGRSTATAEDGLRALLWQVGDMVDDVLGDLGHSRASVAAALQGVGFTMATPVTAEPVVNPVADATRRQGLRLGRVVHDDAYFLLALLAGDPDDVARDALAACGVTHESCLAYFRREHDRAAGYADPAQAVRDPILAPMLLARAEGLALGAGRRGPGSEHGLLAYIWDGRSWWDAGPERLKALGTTASAVLAALEARGCAVPAAPVPGPVHPPPPGRVPCPLERFDGVLAQVRKTLSATYAWDGAGERAWVAQPAPRPGGPPPPRDPATPPPVVRDPLEIATRIARELGHASVTPDHLLLAVLDGHGAGGLALRSFRLDSDAARRALAEASAAAPVGGDDQPPVLPATRRLLSEAERWAELLYAWRVHLDHVLLALTEEWDDHPLSSLLARRGVEGVKVREKTLIESFAPFGPEIVVPTDSLGKVRSQLNHEFLGTYGFNHDGKGTGWIHAPLGVPMEAIADRALSPKPAALRRLLGQARRVARLMHHPWVGTEHLVLALLHPDCAGRGRGVLASFGLTFDDTCRAFADSMGDPFEPHQCGVTTSPAANHVVSEAIALARRLHAKEADSEHVLLALIARWDGNPLSQMIGERGLGAAEVRERMLAILEGRHHPAPSRAAALRPWAHRRRPDLDLALSPDGHDPWRRRRWGALIFQDAQGRAFTSSSFISQYLIDRDGHPVLTTDGRPVHTLVDDDGRPILDAAGRPQPGPVREPPGCPRPASRPDTSVRGMQDAALRRRSWW